MNIACNRKNLKLHTRALLGNEYTPETERELIRECLSGFVREPGHVSHSFRRHIERIDKILGNFGAEGMLLDREGNDLSGNCSERGVCLDCIYSNTGDTYAMTVMYANGKLRIGDWGSLVERLS